MTRSARGKVILVSVLSREATRLALSYWVERLGAQLVVPRLAIVESEHALDGRARDATELKWSIWCRDDWLNLLEQRGLLTHIDRDAIRAHRGPNAKLYDWVNEAWQRLTTDPGDVHYIHAGIASGATFVLTGNATMIADKDLKIFTSKSPPGVPAVLRRDATVEMVAKKLSLRPRECIETAVLGTSPRESDYAKLMENVVRRLKASFPNTMAEIADTPKRHPDYIAMRPMSPTMPVTRVVHQRRKTGPTR